MLLELVQSGQHGTSCPNRQLFDFGIGHHRGRTSKAGQRRSDTCPNQMTMAGDNRGSELVLYWTGLYCRGSLH